MQRLLLRTGCALLVLASVSACAARDRLSYVGQTPPMSPMENTSAMGGANPYAAPAARTVNGQADPLAQLRAVAAAHQTQANVGSLWQGNSASFFGDPRAAQVGDILTVNIDIADSAQVSNSTNRSRTTAEDSSVTALLGGEAALGRFFNDSFDSSNAADFGSSSSLQGAGTVNRSESISLTAAAIVVEVLWNGNMIVHGRQEVRINNEIRELLISGIVRPQDIAQDNTIDHTKIAEARISYGGRGHISDMQRPTIGQEIYNLLWPF